MERAANVSPEWDLARDDEGEEYFCPVCGIGLARSDFDTPVRDYSCPYCGTRQTPSAS